MKVDQLDQSKFHLAVTLNHYANSAEGMVWIARATQKSNKLLQKGRAKSWLKTSSLLIPQFSVWKHWGGRVCLALGISHLLKQTRRYSH